MSSLRRKLAFSLLPAGLLLAGGLVAGEVWARAQRFALDPDALRTGPLSGTDPQGARCYEPHPTRGYSPIPGECGRNDLGFYVYGTEDGVPADPRHVVVLGDSIADQQVWVQEATTVARRQDPALVTFNGGVPGTGSCTQLRIFEESGLALDPDLVMLQFCLNDYNVSATVLPVDDGRRVRIYAEAVTELPAWVLHSRLLTFALLQAGVGVDPLASRNRHRADLAEGCIARLHDLSREHDFELRAVVFPAFVTDPEDPGFRANLSGRAVSAAEAEARITGFLAERGIPTLALRPVLAARGPLEAQRDQPDDVWHPDRPTQLAIGEVVGAFLLDPAP